MKPLILSLIAFITILPVQSQTLPGEYKDYARVTGKYEKKYDPNEYTLGIFIRESDSKGKITIAAQQAAMSDALQALGIDPRKALVTEEISSSHYKKGQNLAFGRYRLTLHSAKEVYEAYTTLHELGISEVLLFGYDRSDREQLEAEGAVEALKIARRKAELIAAAEGRKAGKCFYFSDQVEDDMFVSSNFYPMEITRQDTGSDLTFAKLGEIRIVSYVQAKFVLE